MASILGVEVVARGRRRRGVGAVDDDARSSEQEVIKQLLDQRRT